MNLDPDLDLDSSWTIANCIMVISIEGIARDDRGLLV